MLTHCPNLQPLLVIVIGFVTAQQIARMILGFGRSVNETFALWRCYIVLIDSQSPNLWDNLSVPSSRWDMQTNTFYTAVLV
jgi:hypothetical protein